MRLRNKRTGEIGLVHCNATMFSNKIGVFIDNNHIDLRNPYKVYDSLAELNAEWEDAPEEPKKYWCINWGCAGVCENKYSGDYMDEFNKAIGNYFSSKEEAEKAVEKLKALTEAKEDGLKIKGYYYNHEDLVILADIGKCNKLTLDTLFGKEID